MIKEGQYAGNGNMLLGTTSGAVSQGLTPPQSEIMDKIQGLETNLHYLSAALDSLENRLSPVCRITGENCVEKQNGQPRPVLSPLAERIDSASTHAMSISQRIDKLLHLLAL